MNVIANLNEILQLFDSSYHTSALSSTSTKSPFKSCSLHYSHFQTIVHLSKFFGAPLAIEMWATIFNHKIIQAQPRIKELMMDDFDYESIYIISPSDFKTKLVKETKHGKDIWQAISGYFQYSLREIFQKNHEISQD
ncbi:MAG: hypothetical protein WBB08_12440 [Halobacteriota archaeon]